MDYKGKALKLQEEKNRWEVERVDMMTYISKLKKDENDEKEIMKELMSQTLVDTGLPLVNIERPLSEFSIDDLLVPMSQVSLKDVEIKELKEENKKIKSELARNIAEKNKTLNDKIHLQKKFNELKEKSIGKSPLQGAKHLIWDTLSVEITKFRHYLNFIDNESALVNLATQRLKLANETMETKPLNTAHNALNFLNSLTYHNLQDIKIKDRVAIVLWEKKFINKHQLMKVVHDKVNTMSSQIKDFKLAFKDLFVDGLLYFWDDEGRLFSQEQYHSLLV